MLEIGLVLGGISVLAGLIFAIVKFANAATRARLERNVARKTGEEAEKDAEHFQQPAPTGNALLARLRRNAERLRKRRGE